MFVCLIIRIFQLIFLVGTMLFFHNKSAGTMFRLVFSAKRTELVDVDGYAFLCYYTLTVVVS